jgi:predicted MPP superfamily phosphohydrolase
MKVRRRTVLKACAAAVPALCAFDTLFVEPEWLRVRRVTPAGGTHGIRLAHFTDLHHKGDRAYLDKVVRAIDEAGVDIACFTGDIVESRAYLDDALDALAQLSVPTFAAPGNHEYWANAPLEQVGAAFRKTGGDLLRNRRATCLDGRLELTGVDDMMAGAPRLPAPPSSPAPAGAGRSPARVLLTHCPRFVDNLGDRRFDLMLAGHSHGGQISLPVLGPPIVPNFVGPYKRGLYRTPRGPLYVNPGIGTWLLQARFLCRPEVTVFTL